MKFMPAFLVVVLVCFVPVNSLLAQKDILGDLNCDGLINESDKIALADIIQSGVFNRDADLNLDGFVDLLDINLYDDLCRLALGDGNRDGEVDLLDVQDFNDALTGRYDRQHDFDGDGDVDNDDLARFTEALMGTANSGIVGDLNGDCLINDADKLILDNIIASGQLLRLADVNQDGAVDLLDILPMRQLCTYSLGDGNLNGEVNLLDIRGFVDAFLGRYDRQHDFDGDGDIDGIDVQAFIKVLLL